MLLHTGKLLPAKKFSRGLKKAPFCVLRQKLGFPRKAAAFFAFLTVFLCKRIAATIVAHFLLGIRTYVKCGKQ